MSLHLNNAGKRETLTIFLFWKKRPRGLRMGGAWAQGQVQVPCLHNLREAEALVDREAHSHRQATLYLWGLLLSPKASVKCQLARAACIWVVVGMQGREAWRCGLWLWRFPTFIRLRCVPVCGCVCWCKGCGAWSGMGGESLLSRADPAFPAEHSTDGGAEVTPGRNPKARADGRTSTHIYTHTHYACVYPCTHPCNAHIHAMHTHTDMHMCVYTVIHTCTPTHTAHICMHIHARTHVHAFIHMHKHIHTYTCIHICTRTHTHVYSSVLHAYCSSAFSWVGTAGSPPGTQNSSWHLAAALAAVQLVVGRLLTLEKWLQGMR